MIRENSRAREFDRHFSSDNSTAFGIAVARRTAKRRDNDLCRDAISRAIDQKGVRDAVEGEGKGVARQMRGGEGVGEEEKGGFVLTTTTTTTDGDEEDDNEERREAGRRTGDTGTILLLAPLLLFLPSFLSHPRGVTN